MSPEFGRVSRTRLHKRQAEPRKVQVRTGTTTYVVPVVEQRLGSDSQGAILPLAFPRIGAMASGHLSDSF